MKRFTMGFKKMIAGAGLDVIDGEWLEKELSKHPLINYSKNNNNLL